MIDRGARVAITKIFSCRRAGDNKPLGGFHGHPTACCPLDRESQNPTKVGKQGSRNSQSRGADATILSGSFNHCKHQATIQAAGFNNAR